MCSYPMILFNSMTSTTLNYVNRPPRNQKQVDVCAVTPMLRFYHGVYVDKILFCLGLIFAWLIVSVPLLDCHTALSLFLFLVCHISFMFSPRASLFAVFSFVKTCGQVKDSLRTFNIQSSNISMVLIYFTEFHFSYASSHDVACLFHNWHNSAPR
jgi:hypothetical protein